jgi:hypothetical protein
MKRLWIAPAVLAFTVAGIAAVPASAQPKAPRAQHVQFNRNRDRNLDIRTDSRKQQMLDRAAQIRRRARDLYQSGRLSRDHYDRTLAKFDRIRDDSRERNVLRPDRFRANMDYLNQVENTMMEWSRADGGRRRR